VLNYQFSRNATVCWSWTLLDSRTGS